MKPHALLEDLVPQPPQTGTTFPLLDSMRAVGALAVLTTHTSFWAGDYLRYGTWGTFLARLDVGVAIFFVLSGFLLSRPHFVRAAAGTAAPGTGRYLWKRFLRIAPLYVVAVAVALIFIEANAALSVGDRVSTVFMLNTFVNPSNPAGLTHMWSLAVEVCFYLVLPVLMLLAVGRRHKLRPWRVLTLLVLLTALTIWWHLDGAARVGEHSSGQPMEWLPAYLTWFALGMMLALVQVLHEQGTWSRLTAPIVSMGRSPGSCWALAAGLMLMAATPLAGPSMVAAPTPAQSLTKNLLYAGIGGLIVVSGVFTVSGSGYVRAFGHGLARRLGWISYGIFALHLSVLHFVMWATGWPLFRGHAISIWLLTVALSLVAAELSYRIVERPALRLKNVPFPHPRRRGSSKPAHADTKTPTSGTSAR